MVGSMLTGDRLPLGNEGWVIAAGADPSFGSQTRPHLVCTKSLRDSDCAVDSSLMWTLNPMTSPEVVSLTGSTCAGSVEYFPHGILRPATSQEAKAIPSAIAV